MPGALAGEAGAERVRQGGVGLLRTMPPAPPEAVTRLRAAAAALRLAWPTDERVGERERALPRVPRLAAEARHPDYAETIADYRQHLARVLTGRAVLKAAGA